MKRKFACFLTAFVLLFVASSIPLSANDGTALNNTREGNEPIVYSTADPNVFVIDKGVSIVDVDSLFTETELEHLHFDSDTVKVYTIVTEQWPDSVSYAASECSPGIHKSRVIYKTTSVTNHQPTHPAYCNKNTTYYWRCDACSTTGTETQYAQFFCPSLV